MVLDIKEVMKKPSYQEHMKMITSCVTVVKKKTLLERLSLNIPSK
jgi:hypothetical protein